MKTTIAFAFGLALSSVSTAAHADLNFCNHTSQDVYIDMVIEGGNAPMCGCSGFNDCQTGWYHVGPNSCYAPVTGCLNGPFGGTFHWVNAYGVGSGGTTWGGTDYYYCVDNAQNCRDAETEGASEFCTDSNQVIGGPDPSDAQDQGYRFFSTSGDCDFTIDMN